ncbi:DUF669 domain-containing protein [Lacticaseibacillus paracasei]|uniref:DUF669 domain-containing protein n=1 Tax=Lacticaseibacillus paracasei TaxID=1597 RepID=UPI003F631BD2
MGFVYDASNTGMEPLKNGEYEVYPYAYDVTPARTTGNKMIVMNYRVRDDIEQAGAGSEIRFDNFVDVANSRWRTNALTNATGAFQDKYDFGTIENWAEQMLGKPIRVKIDLEANSNGKSYPKVKNFMKSQVAMTHEPTVKHAKQSTPNQQSNVTPFSQPKQQQTTPDPFAGGSGKPIDISDDDLPF